MDLYINDEIVDFTLESEKTLSDVIRSLERWLADQKMVIAGLSLDGAPCSQKELERKQALPVEDLREIRVTASDFLSLEAEGIQVLTSFFRSLAASLRENDGHVADLLERYPEAESTLRFILGAGADAETGRKQTEWEKLFSGTTAGMIAVWDASTRDRAIAVCDYFIRVLDQKNERYRSLEQSSLKLTRDTIAKLRDVTARLTDVPVLLQTGKDSAAMQTIASFTELAQLFLRLISSVLTPEKRRTIVIDHMNVEEFTQRLNAHLRELVDAFEKKDFILIGDLCEYEIAPAIMTLIDTAEHVLPAPTA